MSVLDVKLKIFFSETTTEPTTTEGTTVPAWVTRRRLFFNTFRKGDYFLSSKAKLIFQPRPSRLG